MNSKTQWTEEEKTFIAQNVDYIARHYENTDTLFSIILKKFNCEHKTTLLDYQNLVLLIPVGTREINIKYNGSYQALVEEFEKILSEIGITDEELHDIQHYEELLSGIEDINKWKFENGKIKLTATYSFPFSILNLLKFFHICAGYGEELSCKTLLEYDTPGEKKITDIFLKEYSKYIFLDNALLLRKNGNTEFGLKGLDDFYDNFEKIRSKRNRILDYINTHE